MIVISGILMWNEITKNELIAKGPNRAGPGPAAVKLKEFPGQQMRQISMKPAKSLLREAEATFAPVCCLEKL